jgi:hypothetical protein
MTAWREKAEELEARMVQNVLVEKMAIQRLKDEEELRFQTAKRRLESALALLGRFRLEWTHYPHMLVLPI